MAVTTLGTSCLKSNRRSGEKGSLCRARPLSGNAVQQVCWLQLWLTTIN